MSNANHVITPPVVPPPTEKAELTYSFVGSGTLALSEDRYYLPFDNRISIWVEKLDDTEEATIDACLFVDEKEQSYAIDLNNPKIMKPGDEHDFFDEE